MRNIGNSVTNSVTNRNYHGISVDCVNRRELHKIYTFLIISGVQNLRKCNRIKVNLRYRKAAPKIDGLCFTA